jgi:hypothetical protein
MYRELDGVKGSRVCAVTRGPSKDPSFLRCLPLFPAEAVRGALPSCAEAGRPRPPPQPPEDSCPNMELGFPRPRPRPRPAGETEARKRLGGTVRFGGSLLGGG